MAISVLRPAAIAATLAAPIALPAVEINQTLYGEVLVEGIHQNNYTDGNGSAYVRIDPTVYNNLSAITTVGGDQFLGGLLIDPETYRLSLRTIDKNTYYQDSSGLMWLRAKLGAKIEVEDSIEANVSFVFDAEGGDRSHFGQSGQIDGGVYLNDANVLLKRFILDELHLRAGRQAVAWNLRRGYGAFLHDSRANDPTVTSWDGVRAWYTWDNFTFSPYHFILDAAREQRGINLAGNGLTSNLTSGKDNTLSGLHIDWQPEAFADSRFFVTGAVSVERNVVVEEANPTLGTPARIGNNLINYYGGIEAEMPLGITAWLEGAIQDGSFTSSQDFGGHAISGGAEWDVGGINNAVIGIQFDHATGDRGAVTSFRNTLFNPNTIYGQAFGLSTFDKVLMANLVPDENNRTYNNFVANWEGVSDALIVEHERYGELSELLVGNLAAFKAKAEYRFDLIDQSRPIHFKFLWSYFMIDTPGYDIITDDAQANYFGNEFDGTVSWQYSKFTTIDLFGGIFMPGMGYRQVAASKYPNSIFKPEEVRDYLYVDEVVSGAGGGFLTQYYNALYPNLAKDDPITLIGLNIHVTF